MNKYGEKQQDEIKTLNAKLAERDAELENERSMVEQSTAKYNSSVENMQELCRK